MSKKDSNFGQATLSIDCEKCGRLTTVPYGEPILCFYCLTKKNKSKQMIKSSKTTKSRGAST